VSNIQLDHDPIATEDHADQAIRQSREANRAAVVRILNAHQNRMAFEEAALAMQNHRVRYRREYWAGVARWNARRRI
jgi:hypothetical protein